MRKLFLLACLMLSVAAFTQKVQNYSPIDLGKTDFSFQYNGSIKDTTTSVDTVNVFTIAVGDKGMELDYDIQVKLERVSGTGTAKVGLYGKKFSSDSWTQIASVRIYNDSTTNFATTTNTRYNYFAIKVQAPTGTHKSYPEYIKGYLKQ